MKPPSIERYVDFSFPPTEAVWHTRGARWTAPYGARCRYVVAGMVCSIMRIENVQPNKTRGVLSSSIKEQSETDRFIALCQN